MMTVNSTTKPQLIDLHFNGLKRDGVNCNFWKAPSDKAILGLRKYLYDHGVRAFMPTLITDSVRNTITNLSKIQEHKARYDRDETSSLSRRLAHMPGVHIEGGYISRTGSHPEQYKEALGPNIVDMLAKKFPGLIKLWTICPQVDKDGKHVEAQRRHGITPSYGHSHASYQEAMDAFKKFGVRLVTHWGNGMKIFDEYNREEPSDEELARLDTTDPELLSHAGLAVAAYQHPEVMMMAICGSDADQDYHISPKFIKKFAKEKPNEFMLATDATACHAGTKSTSGCQHRGYPLSGGHASLRDHAENAHKAGLTEEEIRRATVTNPAKILAAIKTKTPVKKDLLPA